MLRYGHMGIGWGGGWMMLFWILVIVLVIYFLTRNQYNRQDEYYSRNYQQNKDKKNSKAEDIVKERYAKGEIDKEEFEQLIKDLREN
ncbi:MAG: SHOCT domain-containing protein [Halanaerobiales bacterium]